MWFGIVSTYIPDAAVIATEAMFGQDRREGNPLVSYRFKESAESRGW